MKVTSAVCLLLSFVAQGTFASEIDSFTIRTQTQLTDGLSTINQITNEMLDKAIAKSNKNESCDSDLLRKKIFNVLGKGSLFSPIEIKTNHLPNEMASRVKRKDSIYSSYSISEGVALYLYGLGKTISINGLSIGSDKLGHFFHEGWSYYKKMNEGESLEQALDFGEMTERTYYGLQATGVYSHGDLVANYNGLLFWNSLIAGENNYQNSNIQLAPLVACQNGEWVKLRDFDWNEYIDAGWDEAINCSSFREKKAPLIVEEINERAQRINPHHIGAGCPITPEICSELNAKYGEVSTSILHPNCR